MLGSDYGSEGCVFESRRVHASLSTTYAISPVWALIADWTLPGHFLNQSFLKYARLESAEFRFTGTDLLIAPSAAK